MNKAEKIKLLKSLKDGNIPIDDLPLHLASIGLVEVSITLWLETEPGFYEHKETGRTIQEGEPTKDIKPGEVICRIKLFREDGTKVPTLASSEKDIDLE